MLRVQWRMEAVTMQRCILPWKPDVPIEGHLFDPLQKARVVPLNRDLLVTCPRFPGSGVVMSVNRDW
jgi:hypothetical protein